MTEEQVLLNPESGPVVDDDNPWPGLAAFRETDDAFFKGRDQEIAELRRTVQSQRLTVLFGASGLGKTSLLRAGLFPELRDRDEFPVYLRLDFDGAPGGLMEQAFAAALRQAGAHSVDAPPGRGSESLWEYLHRRDAAFWSGRNRLLVPVFVFDQFEEVFSRGIERPEWAPAVRQFLEDLADLAEGRPPERLKARLEHDIEGAGAYDFSRHRYRLVLSLREDYLALLEELRARMPSVASGRCRLLPMDGGQALRVVDLTKGRLVETDVARRIVRFAAGAEIDDERVALEDLRVDPSLLSLFCRELNERRKAAGAAKITEELVRTSQGNIIEGFYEGCFRAVAPELRRFVEDELLTSRGHRDSRAYEDALLRPGVTSGDLDSLVGARLLRIEDRGGARRIELSHDVLTRVARLGRERRHERERLEAERATEFERLRREKEQAERERLERETQLARMEAQRATERRRQFRNLAVLLFVLALFAGGMAWWAISEKQRANEEAQRADETARSAVKAAEQAEKEEQTARLALQQAETDKKALEKTLQDVAAARVKARQDLETAQRDTQKAVRPRVYIQIEAEADRSPAKQQIVPALEQREFVVPGIELVQPRVPVRMTEVRYFRTKEEDGARVIVAILRPQLVKDAQAKYVPGYEDTTKIRPLTYEIWFAAGAPRFLSNLALSSRGAKASQSTTAYNGLAERAIDGNTDGNFFTSSVTHTDNKSGSWWQVELPSPAIIAEIVIWNRSDCCGDRLSNFRVSVLDDSGRSEVWDKNFPESVGKNRWESLKPDKPVKGKFVKIKLKGMNKEGNGYLSLAEVQVIGEFTK